MTNTNVMACKYRAACKKIGTQFPKSGDGKLMYAVVERAIMDLRDGGEIDKRSAASYLKGEIVHAESCSVDSDWIRRVLLGLEIDF